MPSRHTIFRSPTVIHAFDENNPVDFNLYDDEGRQQIYILNDQSPGRQHHLVLINNSDLDLAFKKPATAKFIPSRSNHHFELRFRPGTLDPEFLNWLSVGTGGWRLAYKEHYESNDNVHDGTVSLYLLFVGQEPLVLEKGRTQVIILNHVKAGISGGSRGSRMELLFQTDEAKTSLLPSPLPPSGAPDQPPPRYKRQERLQIINNRGVKELPMKTGFVGSSTVLNDGATLNHLNLQISNFLHNSTIQLNGRDSESPTKFILSFDTSEVQTAWALCDDDNAKEINVSIHIDKLIGTSWHIRPEFQGENPQWIITLIDDIPLEVGEFFHLHLDGLITSMPSGFTRLYLLYENIPGFWDGRFEIPIEKSPLRFDDQKTRDADDHHAHHEDGHFAQKTNIGIGNIEPGDTLDVTGGIRARTITIGNEENVAVPLSVKGKITSEQLEATESIKATKRITLANIDITESEATIGADKIPTVKIDSTLADQHGFIIPPGGIIMWSGTQVPEGWKLCDGGDNTPDLRGRFIVGYPNHSTDSNLQDNYNNPGNLSEGKSKGGNNGGHKKIQLTTDHIPAHQHDFSFTYNDKYTSFQSHNIRDTDGTHQSGENKTWPESRNVTLSGTTNKTGGNQSHENRPPYYVLAFIMKK